MERISDAIRGEMEPGRYCQIANTFGWQGVLDALSLRALKELNVVLVDLWNEVNTSAWQIQKLFRAFKARTTFETSSKECESDETDEEKVAGCNFFIGEPGEENVNAEKEQVAALQARNKELTEREAELGRAELELDVSETNLTLEEIEFLEQETLAREFALVERRKVLETRLGEFAKREGAH